MLTSKKIFFFLCGLCSFTISNAQWIELGTGTNAFEPNSYINSIAVDNLGNVYAAGDFTDTSGYYYVAKWNGTVWSELGTGANGLNANGDIYSITVDNSGNVYAAGNFTDTNSGYYYIAKWNGTSWSELGKGSTSPLNANGIISSIILDKAGNVYAGGAFTDANNNFYVAKWDGASWSEVGTGINATQSNLASWGILAIALDSSGNVYAGGNFLDANNYFFVAKWDGTSWRELGTGSAALYSNNNISAIVVDKAGNVYAGAGYSLVTPYGNVYQWNSTSWDTLGVNPFGEGRIDCLAMDAQGNVYAGGIFSNGGNENDYVAKWDGTSWSELGTENGIFSGEINSIVIDKLGNFYTSGSFSDTRGYRYVAEYVQSTPVTAVTNTITTVALTAYPNPTNGNFTINSPEGGQLAVYNILGEIVTTQAAQVGNTAISLGNAATGVYTLILTGQNNTYTPIKIVKN